MKRTWISLVTCVLIALPLSAAAYPPEDYDPQYELFAKALAHSL